MNRRRFLSFSAALCAAGIPVSFGCRVGGFGGGREGQLPLIDPEDPVRSATERARALGKPLLVLVVPEDDHEQWERGMLFGSLLNHGDESVLMDLALCEVVCASVEELRHALPSADLESNPLMILVEATSDPVWSRNAAPGLPPLRDEDWDTEESEQDESLRERLEFLSMRLHELVAHNQLEQERRAEDSRLSLSEEQTADLLEELSSGLENTELVDRAAGAILGHGLAGRISVGEARSALGRAAKARVRAVPPFGAKWAHSTGCGSEIEGEEEDSERMMIACGMAFVPEIGQRFLAFYL